MLAGRPFAGLDPRSRMSDAQSPVWPASARRKAVRRPRAWCVPRSVARARPTPTGRLSAGPDPRSDMSGAPLDPAVSPAGRPASAPAIGRPGLPPSTMRRTRPYVANAPLRGPRSSFRQCRVAERGQANAVSSFAMPSWRMANIGLVASPIGPVNDFGVARPSSRPRRRRTRAQGPKPDRVRRRNRFGRRPKGSRREGPENPRHIRHSLASVDDASPPQKEFFPFRLSSPAPRSTEQ